MGKKANSSIYHFENYIEIHKLKCVIKLGFHNDKQTPRAEKIKTIHAIKTKWGIRIYCQGRIFIVFTQRRQGNCLKNTLKFF